MAPRPEIDRAGLEGRISGLPAFERVRSAVERTGLETRVIGGAIRDALLGRSAALDLVTVGDHLLLAEALGGEVRDHERFATATVRTGAGEVDVVRARRESYPHPGALPEVDPAGFDEDVDRRDFTVNTIAVPVLDPGAVIDPRRGEEDLRAGVLRVLHDGSFVDDPTRALRAARYSARLGLEVEPHTLGLLRESNLATVSADRVEAELRRIAAGAAPGRGFELLAEWGLISLPGGAGPLIESVSGLFEDRQWRRLASPEDAILAIVRDRLVEPRRLAGAEPESASAIVASASGAAGVELAIARALGAEWLDAYVGELRRIELAISGEDLLEAGVAEGPAIGRGLAAALRAKLDGAAPDRDAELRIALETARSSLPGDAMA